MSLLVLLALWRQQTHKMFQKHIFLFATFLLMCAVISNTLISIYITQPSVADPNALAESIILSKKVQATFDYAFSITIGAFIVVATTPEITTRRDFLRYMGNEFPNSYVFYTFIMALAVVAIYISPEQIDLSRYPPDARRVYAIPLFLAEADSSPCTVFAEMP